MNPSNPSSVVGGGEMNWVTSSFVSSASNDAASAGLNSRSWMRSPVRTGSRTRQSVMTRSSMADEASDVLVPISRALTISSMMQFSALVPARPHAHPVAELVLNPQEIVSRIQEPPIPAANRHRTCEPGGPPNDIRAPHDVVPGAPHDVRAPDDVGPPDDIGAPDDVAAVERAPHDLAAIQGPPHQVVPDRSAPHDDVDR